MTEMIYRFFAVHKGMRRLMLLFSVVLVGWVNIQFAHNFGSNTMGDATGLATINGYMIAVAGLYFHKRGNDDTTKSVNT